MIVEEGIEFVTTSAGSPDKYGPVLKEAGLIVFHVVPTLKGAQRPSTPASTGWSSRAARAPGSRPAATSRRWCCCRWSREARRADRRRRRDRRRAVDGRSVRARRGGRADGHADAVVAGVRRAPEHEAGRVDADETDTMLINRHNGKPVRVLRTATHGAVRARGEGDPMALLGQHPAALRAR